MFSIKDKTVPVPIKLGKEHKNKEGTAEQKNVSCVAFVNCLNRLCTYVPSKCLMFISLGIRHRITRD